MRVLAEACVASRQLSAEHDRKLLELFEEPQAPGRKGRKKDLVSR